VRLRYVVCSERKATSETTKTLIMHSDEILVLIVTLSLFALIFGIVYIRNRENMALIERGINPRQSRQSHPRPFGSLKYGLLIFGAALGLLLAFFFDMNLEHQRVTPGGETYYQDYPQLYFALIGAGAGLGLVISYLIEKKIYDKFRSNTGE